MPRSSRSTRSLRQKKSVSQRKHTQRSKRKSHSQYELEPVPYNWDDIGKEPFFHGFLPRQEALKRLINEGDFLIRVTEVNGHPRVVISVNWSGKALHFIVQQRQTGGYYVGKKNFRSISDLVVFHCMQKVPLDSHCTAHLIRPISLEPGEVGGDQLKLIYPLGDGDFGETYKALLKRGSEKSTRYTEVAVKKASKQPKAPELNHLLEESPRWREFNHPHVLKFFGISLIQDRIMLIMELAKESLLCLLRRDGLYMISMKDRLRYCLEAATGMEYLEKQRCLHNDLGARNCMLDTSKVLKLADYGIHGSELEGEEKFSLKIKTPIKWQAPETIITSIYTFQSDVWSYGILLWEIFSDGLVPYPGMSNIEVSKKVTMEQYRMDPPPGCPRFVCRIMRRCWESPEERPNFKKIINDMKAGAKNVSIK